MDDNLIPFSFKILNFNKQNSSFEVEYIPEDTFYQKIIQTIYIDLSNNPELSKKDVLSILSKNSPQNYWFKQKINDDLDISLAESLINQEVSSEETMHLFNEYKISNLISSNETEDVVPAVSTDVEKFIESILNEQQ